MFYLFNGLRLEDAALEIPLKPFKLIRCDIWHIEWNWSGEILVMNALLCFLKFHFELVFPGNLTSHLLYRYSFFNLSTDSGAKLAHDVRWRKHRWSLFMYFLRHNITRFLHFAILDLLLFFQQIHSVLPISQVHLEALKISQIRIHIILRICKIILNFVFQRNDFLLHLYLFLLKNINLRFLNLALLFQIDHLHLFFLKLGTLLGNLLLLATLIS